MSARLPAAVLAVLVVGLALHNLVMSALWDAGLRGRGLDAAAAWKEAVLAVGLAVVVWRSRRLPAVQLADRLALAYTAIVVGYALIPQDWLGGEATTRGIVLALRHDLVPVAAYGFGRLAAISLRDRRLLVWLAAATAAVIAIWGIADAYLVPLQWWRDSGVPGWYEEQLGLAYQGLSGLPENWVYNTGDELNPIRRLVSTFLSPLATAYMLVIVLLALVSRRPTWWSVSLGALCYLGLLWTHTRAAFLALAAGLVVLAAWQRRWLPVALAAGSLLVGVAFVAVYPEIGPSTSYTEEELEFLRGQAAGDPDASQDPFDPGESSTASHLRNLRDGLERVIRHPQGYGLGNAGVVAKRTGVEILAGESTYTELGVEIGVVGLAAFFAWCAAILVALWRRSGWLTASFAAVLVLALQTDVLGVHWLAFCLWAAVGIAVAQPERGR